MVSNLPPQMLLESLGTVVYTLDSGIFFEVYSSRSAVFYLNTPTSGWMLLNTTHGRSCVQRSDWLMPQVALPHTWVGEDQCRVNPLQRCYLFHTPWALIIIIIIIIIIIVVVIIIGPSAVNLAR
jgi:hypothetical protein